MSDLEFLAAFRSAIDRYLAAVDQWEHAYQKYYRLAGKASNDLQEEESAYEQRKRELEAYLPRARSLCLKHQIENPFPGLVRITLGQFAPQHRLDSAIGRNERSRVTQTLLELTEAVREWNSPDSPPPPRKEGLLARVLNYFF